MFKNRVEAGRLLAARLAPWAGQPAVVVALPRGGVPVGYEIARALRVPLDILVVRKIGAPQHREYGLGAVAEGGVCFVDEDNVRDVGASDAAVAAIVQREEREVARRVARWRGAAAAVPLEDQIAIVVDDGVATGGTVRAALVALRARRPRKIVLAVPVASSDTLDQLADVADEIVCLSAVGALRSISEWYDDFTQVPDDAVAALLSKARTELRAVPARPTTIL